VAVAAAAAVGVGVLLAASCSVEGVREGGFSVGYRAEVDSTEAAIAFDTTIASDAELNASLMGMEAGLAAFGAGFAARSRPYTGYCLIELAGLVEHDSLLGRTYHRVSIGRFLAIQPGWNYRVENDRVTQQRLW
jgi:hypothetical protein